MSKILKEIKEKLEQKRQVELTKKLMYFLKGDISYQEYKNHKQKI